MVLLNGIIPVISDAGSFERFLRSSRKVCFLMNVHAALAATMIRRAHAADKQVIVHLDMIAGLASDEAGCEYLCQVLKADGVISTRAKVVETALRNHCTAILRLFLIDSRSVEKGIAMANDVRPDYLEVLPAIATDILPVIRRGTSIALIGGGLLSTPEQIRRALASGLEAVSCSRSELWDTVKPRQL